MSDGFSQGGGINDLAHTRTLAEAKLAEAEVAQAQSAQGARTGAGTWPRLSTVLRVIGLVAGGLIVSGWLLTSLRAGS